MIRCSAKFNYNERNDEFKYAFCKDIHRCDKAEECQNYLESIDEEDLFEEKLRPFYKDVKKYFEFINAATINNRLFVLIVDAYKNAVKTYEIPKTYQDMSLYHFDANIQCSVRNLSDSVFIVGPVGTGKTTLSWSIMKFRWFKNIYEYYIEQKKNSKYTFEFINVNDMFIQIKNNFNFVKPKSYFDNESEYIHYLKERDHNSELGFVNRLSKVNDLILDDFCSENSTDWTRSVLKSIVNYRWENNLWTCFTSNYPNSHISKNIDQAISSRIAAMCENLELKGRDRRIV